MVLSTPIAVACWYDDYSEVKFINLKVREREAGKEGVVKLVFELTYRIDIYWVRVRYYFSLDFTFKLSISWSKEGVGGFTKDSTI